MKRIATACLATLPLLFLAPSIASANDKGTSYAGVQYATIGYDESGFDEFNPTGLVGRFGHFVADNFAVEGRIGFGLAEDSQTISGIDVSLEVDNLFGVYGVGYLPFNDKVSGYALLGFTTASMTAKATDGINSASASADDDGLSFGIGGQFDVTDKASLNIEYTQYLDGSNYKADAFSFGANFKF